MQTGFILQISKNDCSDKLTRNHLQEDENIDFKHLSSTNEAQIMETLYDKFTLKAHLTHQIHKKTHTHTFTHVTRSVGHGRGTCGPAADTDEVHR